MLYSNIMLTFFTGPQHWHLDHPHCGGVKQSPINIETNDAIVDISHLQPFLFTGYNSVENVNMSMVNNGHTGKSILLCLTFNTDKFHCQLQQGLECE